ncbi:hypothetical protein EDC94DRAFT_192388 [Helicostylum pulchrum]|nr:hypothetical protein EDC94DRAFT_192388 [Helicostylum pulchrum]
MLSTNWVLIIKTKKILNFDFRAKPQLLMLIPPLFSGAIIQDNNLSLVILSCEVYSRSNNVDIHSEPTEYSIPAEGEITCSVHTKSDGRKEIQKLVIGGSFLNLLIVSSVEISNNPKVHVGPGVDFGHCRISKTCNIFVRSICQEQLINQFDSNETIPLTINNLRQLTTHFGKKSTYNPWRSSLSEFNTTLIMPATATTLCSLPSSGYGFGPDSLSFISSQLLQLFSIAVIYDKYVIKNNELESFFMDHSLVLKKIAQGLESQ